MLMTGMDYLHGSGLRRLLYVQAASWSGDRGLPVQTVAGTGGAATGAVSGPLKPKDMHVHRLVQENL